jgi:translation initiation factor 1 (eIF-1/SUI1)
LISRLRTSSEALPKIVTKMKRKISGNTTVKNTAAGSRQKVSWS